MAIVSVASHGERHVNPSVEQNLERTSGTNATARGNSTNGAVAEDTFTPSRQSETVQSTAQAAGIFQLSLAAATANAAPAQPNLNPDQTAAPEQTTPATPSNADSASAAGTTNSNATAVAGQSTGAPAASSAALAGATNVEEQGQVQAFNTELAALGLSNYDILQIDRIATAIQNFNPSAYTDLVNQFERQAQESEQLTTLPATSNSGSTISPPAASNANAGANVSVNLGGAQEAVNPPAANTPSGAQAVQVRAPQNSAAGTTN